MDPLSADVVVVGAGSAGCVVARRLIDAGVSVILLEAGPPDDDPAIHDPATSFQLLGGNGDWGYATLPQKGLDGRQVPCPRGKVLGGSSSLNGMIYARGHRSDFDTWAYAGNAGWGFDDVLDVFKRSEDFDKGASAYHGSGGPLHVLSQYDPHPVLDSLVSAAQQSGVPFNPDYNGEQLDGVSFIQMNIKDGRRHSAYQAFVAPVRDSPLLTVVTDCQAIGLIMQGRRCVGVDVVVDGQPTQVHAAHEVVVSAGVIDTPKLLMLSGIGPAAHLHEVGVAVVHDLPGVGQNLQDHVWAPVTIRASTPIPPELRGIQQFHVHFFWRSRSGLLGPDIQALLVHLPVAPGDEPAGFEGYTLAPMLVRPSSRGQLRLASADPFSPPLIDPGYLRDQVDVDALAAGVAFSREVAQQEALAPWDGKEVFPGPAVTSPDQLRDYVRQTAASNYHPVGSCAMGVDEAAVVDPDSLRVRGLEGLRIADASVMPRVTSANTHAPTVMIAERSADFLLASLAV